MTPPDAVGSAEARELLGGISRTRFAQLAAREDFPQPRELEIGRVWDPLEILAWQKDRLSDRGRHLALLLGYRRTGTIYGAARSAGVHPTTAKRSLTALGLLP